jgi:polar amino acid transport system substrate-binding protein
MKNLAIVLLVGLLCIAACGNTEETAVVTETGGEATAETHAGTLQQVLDSGEVIIGIGQEAAPFGFMDENGTLVGYDVDIARAVVEKLSDLAETELSLVFVPVTDETRISWVQSGEIHMSLCHTNNTRKRDENIDFSVPYGWDGKGVMYDFTLGQRDLEDFQGATIGIKRSSSSEGEIIAYFEAQGWVPPTLQQFDNHTAGVEALVNGQIDGFTDDNSIVINTAMRAGYTVSPEGQLTVTETLYSPAYFAIGIPENDSDWKDMVNYALHELWLSGEFQEIYEKWFGTESMCPIPLNNHHMEPQVAG